VPANPCRARADRDVRADADLVITSHFVITTVPCLPAVQRLPAADRRRGTAQQVHQVQRVLVRWHSCGDEFGDAPACVV